MSHPEASSLLDFIDAPVIVGDPDSRVIYVNPSCEQRLGIAAAVACGESLCSLFEGGSREAVLKAVADVCTNGRTSHFRLRESGCDYLAQASPIEAEGDRVGVVILMTDEPARSQRVETLPTELAEPLDETIACLQELASATSDPRLSDVVERGLAGLDQIQKSASEPKAERCSAGDEEADPATLDPVRVARQVASRVAGELADAGCDFDLLVPRQLPAARGEAEDVEAVLLELIRRGLQGAGENSHFTLSARTVGEAGRRFLLLSVVHLCAHPGEGRSFVTEPAPCEVRERVEKWGGSLYAIASESLGRVTSIQLQLVG